MEVEQNEGPVNESNENEVRNSINKNRNAVGLDELPVEVWNVLGENGVEWLVQFVIG